ncbi:hypothetical protein [Shimia sp. FJ5]|uniref:hypothetical protein n=1 Tax=Shimia sp. FJ5 TaxID=3079054 RepID=UPI00293DB2E2|nr:hypothetical protein [Shimia sp. FJ5]MDV4145830.1 hypothetical protein [Shimia sp. FJ5]
MVHRSAIIAASAFAVVIATAMPADAKLKRKLVRYTAGAAIVSAFSEMCGAKRIGQFQESFIVFAGTKQKLTDKDKTDIMGIFARTKKDAYERVPAGAARKDQCSKISKAERQETIDQGISGNWKGIAY